jgi:hypothetical protein
MESAKTPAPYPLQRENGEFAMPAMPSRVSSPGAYSFVHPGRVSGSRPVSKASGPDRRTILCEGVAQSLSARRYEDALVWIRKLVMLDPHEPRWHQKNGEVLRTLARSREAAAAYRSASRCYRAAGLHARASAAQRVADSLDGNVSTPISDSSDRIRIQPYLPPEERVTARPGPMGWPQAEAARVECAELD